MSIRQHPSGGEAGQPPIGGTPPLNSIHFAGFNQNHGCFAIGMENGFRVYNSDPVKEKVRHTFDPPGLGFIEMLFRCNYLALVGRSGSKEEVLNAPNRVVIWDDLQKKEAITLEFSSDVKAVRLRRDRIVVALSKVIKVFTFTQSPIELLTLETGLNERGICVLCPSSSNSILAYPGTEIGKVHIVNLGVLENNSPTIINAHETPVICLALNQEGTNLATASEKGTLVRVFDTGTAKIIHEVRRGTSSANIYCINFSKDSTMLCVSSDHGTVHVFLLSKDSSSQPKTGIFKLMATPRSELSIKMPEHTDRICAFTEDPQGLVVVGLDGSYKKYSIEDLKGGYQEDKTCHLLDLS
ncbi:WD repeat domain phosphoinositide-interacting protein 3-like [Oopsacas minuta]|uniref:WD repeat domain phosphoinositide-interacting protein 3-like n=1 Tax=Oopsacas minuta TaxID=111878 RepID=A0AAV7K0Q7_9METZ|nr:WD repeat domain phosphoinositide-interacting protein 3-like [Oopsacas minuta]